MKFVMAAEAQRLISISLAKIAASRCVRGGVSLHKNLLVATVLQKARYIFMEEAFHTLHGHYINQANSKFIQQLRYQEQLENQLRQQQQHQQHHHHNHHHHHHHHHRDKEFDDDRDESTSLDDSELDIFSSSSESLNFLNESENKGNPSLAHNSPSSSSSSSSSTSTDPLIYLDLDVNRTKSNNDQNNSIISSGQKRRLSSDEYDSEDSLMSIFPTKSKQIKFSNDSDNSNSSSSDISTDNCLSLDFLSNDLSLTSDHPHGDDNSPTHRSKSATTATANVTMAPLDMSNNTSASATSPSTSSIDRITSLVSIFNFGNLQRSVSNPDLCSSSSNHSTVEKSCCNLQQRQIAMTV